MGIWSWVGVGVTGVILAFGAYVWVSGRGFDAHVEQLRQRVMTGTADSSDFRPELPDIVSNYALRAGGSVGGPAVFHATHSATLATTRDAAPMPITADQWTATHHSALVWHARGNMNGLPVSVLDAFVDGKGELSARLLGAFEVAGGQGPDFDKGELLRYLSELPVYPDAIVNNPALTWRQIDAHSAEVSAAYASGTARMRFYFNPDGDIVRMEADDRPMTGPGGTTTPMPWHGLYGQYTVFGRYRIPAYGEVGWVLDGGLFTYWHGTVTSYEPVD